MSNHHNVKCARRRRPLAASLVLGLGLILTPDLGAQTFSPPEAAAGHAALSFEVLSSGVGSGSRSQTRSELRTKINALEVPETRPLSSVGPWALAAVSNSNYGHLTSMAMVVARQKMRFLPGQQPVRPQNQSLRSVGPAGPTSAVNMGADLLTAAQAADAAPAAVKAEQAFRPRADIPQQAVDQSIEEVIAEWQRRLEDDYQIGAVINPFLPVEDPLDRVDSITLPAEAAWSPLLRLELGQLKLVAVTTVSSQAGDALASFEDASGISYLLRQGDRIGKNKGRIVKIDPAGVVIEERPQGSSASRMVEMRLTI